MRNFDWEIEKKRRSEELLRVPTADRAKALFEELMGVGFLRSYDSEAQNEILDFTTERMTRWGMIEAPTVLSHAGESVSVEIEGDFYEDGSYAREMKRFFEMTHGEIVVTDIRDIIEPERQQVRVLFNWEEEAHELTSRAPDAVSDYFDAGILRALNRVIDTHGLSKRFVGFIDAEAQSSGWVFIAPERRHEIQSKHLLIFDEKIPYTQEALAFFR